MDDSVAIPILQIALFDPIDEVRLLAYSMLNTKEKSLSSSIQTHLTQLKREVLSKPEQAVKHHYIAEAYWELAYLGLEQGQAKIHVLETANHYAMLALSFFTTNGDLYFLRAKIFLELAQYPQAAENFTLAQGYGMSEERLAPYQAELAFAEHRLADVSYFMQKIKQSGDNVTLSDMVNQWI
ncbi:MAG: hypothetical protein NTV00_02960 [Methylococcales bacterium]|nr:hypothetical protein [Methylococcales bacterium]